MIPYKSREIPGEFNDQVEKFIRKLKNSLDRGLLKMTGKFLKFLKKIDWNLQKNERSSRFEEYFHRAGKIKKPACKILLVSTKNQEGFHEF